MLTRRFGDERHTAAGTRATAPRKPTVGSLELLLGVATQPQTETLIRQACGRESAWLRKRGTQARPMPGLPMVGSEPPPPPTRVEASAPAGFSVTTAAPTAYPSGVATLVAITEAGSGRPWA